MLNNPPKWTDPTEHNPLVLALGAAGITVTAPAIAVIAAALTVAALVIFLNDANNRSWLDAQIRSGIDNISSTADHIFQMARKEDLRYIDYLGSKYGLTKAQRRRLHDEITKKGLSREEIEEIAKELADESNAKSQNRQSRGK